MNPAPLTLSGRTAAGLQEVASILGFKSVESFLAFQFEFEILDLSATNGCDHMGALARLVEETPFKREARARAVADRIKLKLEPDTLIEVHRSLHEGWRIRFFSGKHPHWRDLWLHCHQNGKDYRAALKWVQVNAGEVGKYPEFVKLFISQAGYL